MPESNKVDDIKRGDVIRAASQVVLPEALPPEAEAVHLLVVVTEGGIAVWRSLRPTYMTA